MANEIDLVVGSVVTAQIKTLMTELTEVDNKIKEIGRSAVAMNTALGVKDTASLTKLTAENEKLNKKIQELTGSSAVLETKLANLAAAQSKATKAATDASIAEEKLLAATNKNTVATEKKTKAITEETIAQREANKQATVNATINNEQVGAYKRLEAQYQKTAQKALDLGAANKQNTEEYKRLVKESQELGQRLKSVDSDVGKHTRNVGNYSSSWNGLGNSINQLTREAPAFANSLQTGFMALSNNIPILTDELGVLIAKNKALQADGKPTESILKTVAGAFFSWQTAISLGVTILTVYGSKLITIATNAFSVYNNIKLATEAVLDFNDATSKGVSNSKNELAIRDNLLRIAKNEKLSMEQRKEAIKELRQSSVYYTKNITDEMFLTNKAAPLIDVWTKAIVANSKAKTQESSLSKTRGIISDIENELDARESYFEKRKRLINDMNIYDKSALIHKVADKEAFKQDVEKDIDLLDYEEKLRKKRRDDVENNVASTKSDVELRKILNATVKETGTLQSSLNKNVKEAILLNSEAYKAPAKPKEVKDKPERERKVLTFDEVKSQHDLDEAILATDKIREKSVDMSDWTTEQKIANLDLLSLTEIKTASEVANKEIDIANKKMADNKTANDLALKNNKNFATQHAKNILDIEKTNKNEIKLANEVLNGKILESALNTDKAIKVLDDEDLKATQQLAIAKLNTEIIADKLIIDNKVKGKNFTKAQQEEAFKEYVKLSLAKIDLEEKMRIAEEPNPIKQEIIKQNFADLRKGIENILSPVEEVKKAFEDLSTSGEVYNKSLSASLDKLGMSSLKTFLDFDVNGKSSFEKMWENADTTQKKTTVMFQTIGDAAQQYFGMMAEVSEANFQEDLRRLDAQKEISLGFAGDSAVAKAKIEADYDKKRKELELKQFKDKQKMAVANIAIDTGQAIMQIWAHSPDFSGISQSAMSVIIGALGAVQIGMVLAQKPPAYAEGTDNHSGGLMLVNDGKGANYEEKVILPSGKVIRPQGRNVLMDAPKGTKVLNHEQQLFEMLQSNNISMSSPQYQGMTPDEMDEILGKHFGNIKTQNTIFDKNGFQSYVKNGNSITRSNSNRSQAIGISV